MPDQIDEETGMPARIARRLADREVRQFTFRERPELREESGQLMFTGYATVFDYGYDMYGGPKSYGWTEYMDTGCFDKTLAERCDTQLLINHRDMPLARTKSGTLKLSADKAGLHVEAGLEPSDPDVVRLRPKMDRGDMDEMSLAFRVMRQEWSEEYDERHIKEASLHKGDVSVVNYGANDATSAQLRSMVDMLADIAEMEPGAVLAELRSEAGTDPLAVLSAARDAIDECLRTARPTKRGMSLATARARIEADTLA